PERHVLPRPGLLLRAGGPGRVDGVLPLERANAAGDVAVPRRCRRLRPGECLDPGLRRHRRAGGALDAGRPPAPRSTRNAGELLAWTGSRRISGARTCFSSGSAFNDLSAAMRLGTVGAPVRPLAP